MDPSAAESVVDQVRAGLAGSRQWLDQWSRLHSAALDDGRLVVQITDDRAAGCLFWIELGVTECLDGPGDRVAGCRDLLLDNVREIVVTTGRLRPDVGRPGGIVRLPTVLSRITQHAPIPSSDGGVGGPMSQEDEPCDEPAT